MSLFGRKPKPKPEPVTIERFLHLYDEPGERRISVYDTLYADICRRIKALEADHAEEAQ